MAFIQHSQNNNIIEMKNRPMVAKRQRQLVEEWEYDYKRVP